MCSHTVVLAYGCSARCDLDVETAREASKGLVMHCARVVLVDGAAGIRAYHLATDEESMARLRANLRRLLAAPSRREGRTQ